MWDHSLPKPIGKRREETVFSLVGPLIRGTNDTWDQ